MDKILRQVVISNCYRRDNLEKIRKMNFENLEKKREKELEENKLNYQEFLFKEYKKYEPTEENLITNLKYDNEIILYSSNNEFTGITIFGLNNPINNISKIYKDKYPSIMKNGKNSLHKTVEDYTDDFHKITCENFFNFLKDTNEKNNWNLDIRYDCESKKKFIKFIW